VTKLLWDEVGKRTYETGVDHGVLYIQDGTGAYTEGYAWNGLTTVTEAPSGAASNPQYADNIKYLNLLSAEQFGATVQAFTYPDEFGQCDGTTEPQVGVSIGQQARKTFGLAYRTKIGNDVDGSDHGYKIHLVYGCLAAPSQKAYATVNDSPAAVAFSWDVTTTPVAVTGAKPTATLVIDSTKVDADALATLEDQLYGTAGADPRLPLPDDIIALFAGTITLVTPTQPTYTAGTHTITFPAITGVVYKVNGVTKTGTLVIAVDTPINAYPAPGYAFHPADDTYWVQIYS
jgi:hypothetical protein